MEDGQQRDWNMALAFLQRLDKRLDERDMAREVPDLYGWYRILSTIYSNIHFRLEEYDANNETTFTKDVQDKLNAIKKSMNQMTGKGMNIKSQISNVEEKLNDLDLEINDLIYALDFLGMKKRGIDPEAEMEDL